MTSKNSFAFIMLIGMLAQSSALHASGNHSVPVNPTYLQECGSCHVAYPARMLPATSWQALMSGLDKHFGVNATLEDNVRQDILQYLQASARRGETGNEGKPILRITEARWFRNEHDEISQRIWQMPSVKSPANCSACHTAAEQGIYSEHQIRLP
jgi:hypothetical protein